MFETGRFVRPWVLVACVGFSSVLGCKSRKESNRPDETLRLLSGRAWQVSTKAAGAEARFDGDVLYIEGDRHLFLDASGKLVDQGGFETPGEKRVRFRTAKGRIDVEALELTADRALLRGTMTMMGTGMPFEIALKPNSGAFNPPVASNLHEAAALGDVLAIRRFLSAQANVDAMEDGMTALMLAAYHCHPAAVEALLQAGAKPDLKSDGGSSALTLAVESGDLRVVRALLSKKVDVSFKRVSDQLSPVVIAADSGDVDMVRALVEAGANLQDKNEYGDTVLCIASNGDVLAKREFPDLVKLILDRKVDPNQPCRSGAPPLFNAVSGDFPKTVRVLLERGADPNAKDPQGRTLAEYGENSPAAMEALRARR
jgi:hypothetical protein